MLNSDERHVLEDRTRSGTPKIPALTGIRGVAAAWVVLFHLAMVANVGKLATGSPPVVRSGHLGVDLFFVLSGFVLMLTYGRSFERPARHALRDFWIGRVFRILPLHWFVLALLLGIGAAIGGRWVLTERHDVASFLASLALVQGWLLMPKVWNLPAWSLSAEWLAYLAFPVMAMIAARVRTVTVAVALSVGAWALLTAACVASGDFSLDHIRTLGLARCLLEFPIGMMLCRIWQLRRLDATTGTSLFAAGIVVLAMAMIAPSFDLLIVPAVSLIILACATDAPVARRLLANRVAVFLGDISFSVYLMHWVVLELIAHLIVNKGMTGNLGIACLTIGFAMIWPLAWLTWRYIEVPGQARSRTLIRKCRLRDQLSHGVATSMPDAARR